jgi:MOSC domain
VGIFEKTLAKGWRQGDARCTALVVALVHRFPMRELEEVRAIREKGFQGCIHGRPRSKRQVLLMDFETLHRLEIAPGAVKENITTHGLNMREISVGQRLRIGGALLEVSVPCEPCERMDRIRPGLRAELRDRRGWLCRVVEAGELRRGDEIEVMGAGMAPESKGEITL